MATPGPSTQRYNRRLAGRIVQLARLERGWTQRQLAEAAGVPVSTVGRIETGARQPSLLTLSRLLAAADLELRIHVEPYDDHDDVLDARRALLSDEQRDHADQVFARTSELLAASRRERAREQAAQHVGVGQDRTAVLTGSSASAEGSGRTSNTRPSTLR